MTKNYSGGSVAVKAPETRAEIEGKEILFVSSFDEWYGPIYRCPFCAEQKIMQDFNFCPNCGGNMEGYGFETVAEVQKRMELLVEEDHDTKIGDYHHEN